MATRLLMTMLLLALLSGCATGTPLPSKCQEVGVAVADDDVVTGVILESNEVGQAGIDMQCWPLKNAQGCAINAGGPNYVIWYIQNNSNVKIHEECHAFYEQPNHLAPG